MKIADSLARVAGLRIRLVLAVLLGLSFVVDTSPLSRAWYDLKARTLVSDPVASPRITVVDIDDQSLSAIGRWPWSRVELTTLMSLLQMAEPELIAVDLFFPEPSGDDDLELLALLEDPRFVLVTAFDFQSDQRSGELAVNDADRQKQTLNNKVFATATGWVGLFSELADAMDQGRVGHVNIIEDPDGVVRRLPGLIRAGGHEYSNLPSQIVGSVTHRSTMGRVDRQQYLIPYVFDPRLVRTVSAVDVLSGVIPEAVLKGQILVLGSSAAGLADRVMTPMGYPIPGVTLQALIAEAWLSGIHWDEAVNWTHGSFIIAIALGVYLIIVFPNLVTVRALVMLSGFMVFILVANWLDFFMNARVWDPSHIVSVGVIGSIMMAYQLYLVQIEAATRVRDMFQAYVPERVLDTLLAGDIERFDRGERAKVTVLFADLVGFTRLAETSEPEKLTQTVRHVFNALTEAILRHGGTVDKYMGDAVMAFWGAPLPDADQETRAVACALEMQQIMTSLPYDLELGVGINSGDATVGNMGSDFRHAYSVLGDSVNIAARLESQTRVLGCSILLGEATALRCSQTTESMGMVAVKGKRECIEVFCLPQS